MKKLICNPLNLEYRYQIKKSRLGNALFREAADPTMILFNDTYYLFASMSGGFWYSDDLCNWMFKPTPELPIYDYAPDVREVGGAVIFCASKRGEACTFFRSNDPLKQPFTPISTPFDFWDPNVFQDDDGHVYFYWGCSTTDPIWGIEMDAVTMQPIGEKVVVIREQEDRHGWERKGENNKLEPPKTPRDEMIRKALGTKPCIEGAYMTKHDGKYYLQYATPGTEANVYSDGVYTGEHPLGPFTYQPHNPFSSRPGGFITAAGHGSTFQDKIGNWWHVSTMRISKNDNFERRIGLFPCGFDADGILYCNQNFADYPFSLPDGKRNNMDEATPEMMLLSYKKATTASSSQSGHEPEKGTDESIRTWWAAEQADKAAWYQLDLGQKYTVEAIQLNFADHHLPIPEISENEMHEENIGFRLIITEPQCTRFFMEGSEDGENFIGLKDNRDIHTDYPHDLVILERPAKLRFIRLSGMEVPMGGVPTISGLRVFGKGNGKVPARVETADIRWQGELNIILSWPAAEGAGGYNIRYGISPDKLYSSWQVYNTNELDLSMVNKNQSYYIAVDSFNENGVTTGEKFFIQQKYRSSEE